MRRREACAVLVGCVLSVVVPGLPDSHTPTSSVAHAASTSSTATKRAATAPVWAYYYIWFDPASWNRAKIDLPTLGKYSSDDATVMRKHIRLAKQAGITGFIVSWKHSPTNDRRLARLIDVAASEHFSLAMIYQGLDFHKRPLPAAQVAADLDLFARVFAPRSPFRGFSKPLVIWSGTWKFSTRRRQARDQTRSGSGPRAGIGAQREGIRARRRRSRRRRLLLVVSQPRHVPGLSPEARGSWRARSTITTDCGSRRQQRASMRARSAAPPLCSETAARRCCGECATAYSSQPDVVGIISWNEFSENTYIEPSKNFGTRYVAAAARCRPGTSGPPSNGSGFNYDVDSSAPGRGFPAGLVVVPVMIAAMAAAVVVSVRRRRQGPRRPDANAASSKTTS